MQRHFLLIVGALATVGCSDPGPSARVARIDVASAMDSILNQGAQSQLTATARDAEGKVLSASFTWQSSNTTTATVGANGLVSALTPGTSTIRVTAPAEPGVEGTLAIRVVDADLTTIAAITADPFADIVLAALSTGARPGAETSWNKCATQTAAQNIVGVRSCISELRTQAGAVTEGTDRALLATLAVFADHIERRLAL